MQAVILCGGYGTRLRELVRSTPKPMLHIYNNKVFLDILIEFVKRQGVQDIVLLAGYLGSQIEKYYKDKDDVSVFIEDSPMGTAGCLNLVSERLQDKFYLLNGDSFFDCSLDQLDSLFVDSGDTVGALYLTEVDDASRYGSVILEEDYVLSFKEKEDTRVSGITYINAGVYLFRKSILQYITKCGVSLEKDVPPNSRREGKLKARTGNGYFIDIGIPETLYKCRNEIYKILE